MFHSGNVHSAHLEQREAIWIVISHNNRTGAAKGVGALSLTMLCLQSNLRSISIRFVKRVDKYHRYVKGVRKQKEDDNENDDNENSNNNKSHTNKSEDSEQVGRPPFDATVTVESFRLLDMIARTAG